MLFPGDPDFQEAEARAELAPLHDVLREIVVEAADTLKSVGRDHPELGLAFEYLALRQHTLNSLVVVKVQSAVTAGRMPDADISTTNRFIELKLDTIDLRFKQIRKDGTTANYPTETSLKYKNQLPLLGDATTLDRARLTLGWRWNVAATDIADIVVVYAKGDDTRWMYSILHVDEQPLGIETTGSPAPQVPSIRLRRRKADGQ